VPSDEQSPLWANARRSFVTALEVVIHQAQDFACKLEELPTAIDRDKLGAAVGRAIQCQCWASATLTPFFGCPPR
jgi:hypothetical protein